MRAPKCSRFPSPSGKFGPRTSALDSLPMLRYDPLPLRFLALPSSQLLQELTRRPGINHIFLLEPTPPCHGHPVADETQIPGAMRIGRDDHLHALLLAHPQVHV